MLEKNLESSCFLNFVDKYKEFMKSNSFTCSSFVDLEGILFGISNSDDNFVKMSLSDKVALALSVSTNGHNFLNRYSITHSFRVGRIMREFSKVVNDISGVEKIHPRIAHIAGAYHDIGHLTTPKEILLKPDTLSPSEFIKVKGHIYSGEKILSILGVKNRSILDGAKYHQEKFNGEGYIGIDSFGIPFIARMLQIADVYDALRGKRTYKDSMSREDSIELMYSEQKPNMVFDPVLIDIFYDKVIDEIDSLYKSQEFYENQFYNYITL